MHHSIVLTVIISTMYYVVHKNRIQKKKEKRNSRSYITIKYNIIIQYIY